MLEEYKINKQEEYDKLVNKDYMQSLDQKWNEALIEEEKKKKRYVMGLEEQER